MTESTRAPQIALLAANGVTEAEMTAIQRTLGSKRWMARVVSPESGLIHSWAENVWGHCYPSDAKLEVSLGSDYDMLILPGGARHVEKLMANPHTKRFVSAFFMMNKPVAVFKESARILAENGLEGPSVIACEYDDAEALAARCAAMMAAFEKAAAEMSDEAAVSQAA